MKARAESSEEEVEDDDEDSYEDDDDDDGKSKSSEKKKKNKQASSKPGASKESNLIQKNSEGDAYMELSNARRVTIRSFKGSVSHLRPLQDS